MKKLRRMRGFTFLEMVIVIAMIGTLIGVALYKITPLVHEAERVAVARIEGNLRSALMMEAAKRIASGRGATLAELADSNPMALLLEAPATYLGEIAGPAPGDVPVRYWYFDTVTKRLVYRAGDGFRTGRSQPEIREYVVQLAFVDRDSDGSYGPAEDEFVGLRLKLIKEMRDRAEKGI